MVRKQSDVGLEVYTWAEAGYRPLVFSHDWQVALLNLQQDENPENAGLAYGGHSSSPKAARRNASHGSKAHLRRAGRRGDCSSARN